MRGSMDRPAGGADVDALLSDKARSEIGAAVTQTLAANVRAHICTQLDAHTHVAVASFCHVAQASARVTHARFARATARVRALRALRERVWDE